jgi:uncharacterized protein (DUF1015 family)
MAVVEPLAALRYDQSRVGDPGLVLAPPYDVISPAEQNELYARSPYNVIRLILPRGADRAASAGRTLREWVEQRILVRDAVPAIYVYSQRFTLHDGTSHRRDGVLCRLRLEEFSRGIVLPHERTLPGPKADRLAIFRATGANLSPIFGLYARRGERVRDLIGKLGAPDVDVDGWHQLWAVTNAAVIARFQAALADETVVIADGHHRYETALAYRDEQPGNAAAQYVLAYLANMEEEGVVILPTHRLVRGALPLAAADLEARLRADFDGRPLPDGVRRGAGEIDVVMPDRRLRLRARASAQARLAGLPAAVRELDVALLRAAILEPLLRLDAEALDFTHDDDEAIEAVTTGRAGAAFLLNPPTLAQVRGTCLAGEVMPEKSTYFYPKLATGLVLSQVGPPWV